MLERLRRRYLDLIGSIYIYNEHRGYTAIDRLLAAVRARTPGNVDLIAAIGRHRDDERKHYRMFRRWFELRGAMPFAVDRTCGHIDQFVGIMFGCPIDSLDNHAAVADDRAFAQMCRVIALTERRGHEQVDILLRHPLVRGDPVLRRIFGIIRKDEPSHWEPYEGWLIANDQRPPNRRERAIDGFIHARLLFVKLPLLFLNPLLRRRDDWADTVEERSPVAVA